MDKPTLLPCPNPWCEAAERGPDYIPVVRLHHFGTYRVVCTSCMTEGPLAPTKAEAITAWNTRIKATRPQAVPREPTAEMVEAALAAMGGNPMHASERSVVWIVWRAMFDAAPSRPQAEGWQGVGGYEEAFYEIAKLLGIGARTASPKEVWENEMRPLIERLSAEREEALVVVKRAFGKVEMPPAHYENDTLCWNGITAGALRAGAALLQKLREGAKP